MRALVLAISLIISFAFTGPQPAHAQDAEIQGVITSQIDAFKVDDFATAFTFAAPSIQNIFRTPENFGRMVSQGYPMVWRPAEVNYLGLRKQGSAVLQDVEIIDGDGTVHYLEYRMERLGGAWRISGVRLIEAPGLAA